jgi:TPR repeat protein
MTEAQRMLGKLLEQSARGSYNPVDIARVYLGLGDKDRAFEWLSKAVEQHAIQLDLGSDSMFDPIRSDPRFHALLQRMKLL